MTDVTEKPTLKKVISLVEAREIIRGMEITQEELTVLSRMEARQRGFHVARKLARPNVSMFLTGRLTRGQVYEAIFYAVQKILGVKIDPNLDAVNHD